MEIHQNMAFTSLDEDDVFMLPYNLKTKEAPTRKILTIKTLELHR